MKSWRLIASQTKSVTKLGQQCVRVSNLENQLHAKNNAKLLTQGKNTSCAIHTCLQGLSESIKQIAEEGEAERMVRSDGAVHRPLG